MQSSHNQNCLVFMISPGHCLDSNAVELNANYRVKCQMSDLLKLNAQTNCFCQEVTWAFCGEMVQLEVKEDCLKGCFFTPLCSLDSLSLNT